MSTAGRYSTNNADGSLSNGGLKIQNMFKPMAKSLHSLGFGRIAVKNTGQLEICVLITKTVSMTIHLARHN